MLSLSDIDSTHRMGIVNSTAIAVRMGTDKTATNSSMAKRIKMFYAWRSHFRRLVTGHRMQLQGDRQDTGGTWAYEFEFVPIFRTDGDHAHDVRLRRKYHSEHMVVATMITLPA